MRAVGSTMLMLVFSGSVTAGTLYVDVNGPNEPGTGAFNDPFRRVGDAINKAETGDVIEIRPGVYSGSGNHDLDLHGKALTIHSTGSDGPDAAAKTIIDAAGAGRIFYFHSGEDANCILSGLTFSHGATTGSGGAIYCQNSSPVIRNSRIINNIAIWGGGGIYCRDSNMVLENCVVAANTSNADGGGIYCSSGRCVFVNCTISGNTAAWSGDGIYCYDANCLIENSIIWGNDTDEINITGGIPMISYCDIRGGWPGPGNINYDPCFASFSPNDANLWDFHLQSAAGRWNPNTLSWVTDPLTSPCVDAGEPGADYSEELWPNGKRINIGAYGGTAHASMSGNPADFDVDGIVDFSDFADFAAPWESEQKCIEDLNADGVVDIVDFEIFAENWLWQRN